MSIPVVSIAFVLVCLASTEIAGNADQIASPAIGRWEGVLLRDGAALPVSFTFSVTRDALVGTFSSPTQRALDIPLRNVRMAGDSSHFELVGDASTIVFDGTVSGDALVGRFTEGTAAGEFTLKKRAAEPPPYREEDVQFANGDVTLGGSLLLPRGKGPHAAVILLHGAGAEGRFASRFVADRLARAGIAALIYDKRGVGKSSGDWRRASFSDLTADAAAGVTLLVARRDIRSSHIGVYGHSQGGMLAPFLASRSKHVRFVVSGAAGALPVREGEVHSITNQLRSKGVSEADMPAASEYVGRYVAALASGAYTADFAAETEKVKSASWFPHVHVPAADSWFWKYYSAIASYDAAQYWRAVTVPVLVMYGERDLYVPVARSIANIDRAMQYARNQDYTIIVLPRASHAFNIEPEPGGAFEWSRVAPGFPDIV